MSPARARRGCWGQMCDPATSPRRTWPRCHHRTRHCQCVGVGGWDSGLLTRYSRCGVDERRCQTRQRFISILLLARTFTSSTTKNSFPLAQSSPTSSVLCPQHRRLLALSLTERLFFRTAQLKRGSRHPITGGRPRV